MFSFCLCIFVSVCLYIVFTGAHMVFLCDFNFSIFINTLEQRNSVNYHQWIFWRILTEIMIYAMEIVIL